MLYVAYYRVSTTQQGVSGLGLEAQKAAVASYIRNGELLTEYTEVESGKRHRNRPQLLAALAECKKRKATLVIAKLDRLSRNVSFISSMMDGGVDFICCDMPSANRLSLHILAAVAEDEARRISERTKAALQEVRKELAIKGSRVSKSGRVYTSLGNPEIYKARLLAQSKIRENSASPEVIQLIRDKRAQGKTYRLIADEVNGLNIRAPRGGQWYATSIKNQIDRLASPAPAQ